MADVGVVGEFMIRAARTVVTKDGAGVVGMFVGGMVAVDAGRWLRRGLSVDWWGVAVADDMVVARSADTDRGTSLVRVDEEGNDID